MMLDKNKLALRVSYTLLWSWLVLVTVVFYMMYQVLGGILWKGLLGVPWLGEIAYSIQTKVPLGVDALVFLAGLLVWWRIIKVTVLNGSPLTFGMLITEGRENGGTSGRVVTSAFIGDIDVYGQFNGPFLYGAVFRAHPNSDKIVRSRLETLILALPFGWTFQVHESRLFFDRDTHEDRAKKYRLVTDKYSKVNQTMPPDRFRNELVRHARLVGQNFDRSGRGVRIDGLNWIRRAGGGGIITDDFGYQISYTNQEGGEFLVKQLGTEGKDEKVVASIQELRELAKSELNPT